jgi:hypothetical protein
LLAGAAGAQVIEDDGVPLEVRPALNFDADIACTNSADSTDCAIFGSAGDGDILLYSIQDAGAFGGDGLVDFADAAFGTDGNGDGVYDFTCSGGICHFDANGDGFDEITLFPLVPAITFDANSDGVVDFGIGNTAAGSGTQPLRSGGGLGVGNLTNNNTATSTCLGRGTATTPDKLWEDKDCDYQTVSTPETTPTGSSNAEAFITDMQRRLSADFTTAATGAGNGVQVANLKLDLDYVGAYWIEFTLLTQSALATCGMSFGVTYTAAFTSLFCTRTFVATSGAAISTDPTGFTINSPVPVSTGVTDDVAATLTGQLVEGYASNVASSVTPLLGPNDGVATVNSTALEKIHCNLLTTAVGDLQLWALSETGSTIRVMANSMVRATAFP